MKGTPPEVRFRFLNADGKGPSTMMNIARMYNREMFLRLLVVTLSLVSTHSTATDESELWTQKSAPLVPSYPNHPPLQPGQPEYPPWPEYPPVPETPLVPLFPHPPHTPSPPPRPPPATWPNWPPHPPRSPPKPPPPPAPVHPPPPPKPPPPPPEPADATTSVLFLVVGVTAAVFGSYVAFFKDARETPSAFFRRQMDKIVLGGRDLGGGSSGNTHGAGSNPEWGDSYVVLADHDGGYGGDETHEEIAETRNVISRDEIETRPFFGNFVDAGRTAFNEITSAVSKESSTTVLLHGVDGGDDVMAGGSRNNRTNRSTGADIGRGVRQQNSNDLNDFAASASRNNSRHHLRGASSVGGSYDQNAAYGMAAGVGTMEQGGLIERGLETERNATYSPLLFPPESATLSTPRFYEDDYQPESETESTQSESKHVGGVRFYGHAARQAGRTQTPKQSNVSGDTGPAAREWRDDVVGGL